jgi:hypothetical protein
VSILLAAERLAATTAAVSGAYADELATVLRALERELRSLAIEAEQGSRTALMRAIAAGRARQQITQALEDAGYGRLVARFSDASLDVVVDRVEKLRGAAALSPFVAEDEARILALKKLAEIDLLGQGEAIAAEVWRTTARGIFTGQPLHELLDDLADTLDEELSTARTLYDTSVNVFTRQLEAMKATGEPDEIFAYVGPRDRKTREFCDDRVGKVFTRDEIDDMDNGQLPNVFLTGGGYNCRHVWMAVSQYGDAAGLAGTDDRLPEYDDALTE